MTDLEFSSTVWPQITKFWPRFTDEDLKIWYSKLQWYRMDAVLQVVCDLRAELGNTYPKVPQALAKIKAVPNSREEQPGLLPIDSELHQVARVYRQIFPNETHGMSDGRIAECVDRTERMLRLRNILAGNFYDKQEVQKSIEMNWDKVLAFISQLDEKTMDILAEQLAWSDGKPVTAEQISESEYWQWFLYRWFGRLNVPIPFYRSITRKYFMHCVTKEVFSRIEDWERGYSQFKEAVALTRKAAPVYIPSKRKSEVSDRQLNQAYLNALKATIQPVSETMGGGVEEELNI